MAGFADKERGSSGIQWGKLAAGAGAVSGIALAAVGVTDSGQEIMDAITGTEPIDAAAEAAKQAAENVPTEKGLIASSLDSMVDTVALTIQAAPSGSLEESIQQVIERTKDAHESGLFTENSDWKKIFDTIDNSSATNLVDNLKDTVETQLSVGNSIPGDYIIKSAETMPYLEFKGNMSDARDAVVEAVKQINADDLMNHLESKGSTASEIVADTKEYLTDRIAQLETSTTEKVGGFLKDHALEIGGGALAVASVNQLRKDDDAPPPFVIDERAQNAQMGFAAKEQMRAVNSLMEERQKVFGGQGQAPSGPAIG